MPISGAARRWECVRIRSVMLLLKKMEAPGTRWICHYTENLAGQRRELTIFLARWEPPNIECTTQSMGPNPSVCMLALGKMPASELKEVFGARGEVNIDVPLPVRYSSGCQSSLCTPRCVFAYRLICLTADVACTIDVSLTGPPAEASWYAIWTSAVSIVAMCARFFKGGVSVRRCRFPHPRHSLS